ncbi:MAG: hypothetical protein NTX20_04240 [Verrucomicrobia bacterium]|nr:hypothetical protein [Verrucomicrobiota bacterium]
MGLSYGQPEIPLVQASVSSLPTGKRIARSGELGQVHRMGIREDFLAKLAVLKESARARNATLLAGRPAKVLTAEELAKGHPKVSAIIGFQAIVYETRMGRFFGWFWLTFTSVLCVAMFYGLSRGSVKVSGTLVEQAAWWHYLGLALFYVPFFLIGFAFTVARYRVELTDAIIVVRWRILPYVGWTWRLPVGDEVKVSLAYRGSSENDKPSAAIVVASQGKDIDFGAFLADDVKEFLAGAIRYYYGSAEGTSAPFITND